MTRDQAEAFARERLKRLAEPRDRGHNDDWTALSEAAERALAGDRTAIATFRRVFTESGFAVSNSCMEVGYAALGLGLLGDTASRHYLTSCTMLFNGNGEAIEAALVLLA